MTEDDRQARDSKQVIYLRVSGEAQSGELKITIEEKSPGEESTLQQFIKKKASFSEIQSISTEVFSHMYQFSHTQHINQAGSVDRLIRLGQQLYDNIFSLKVKERLANAKSKDLFIVLDDSLISVPWEILHDGEEFLCLQYNMGRSVSTSQDFHRPERRGRHNRIKILILADSRHDLPDSYQEGLLLNEELSNMGDHVDCFLETRMVDSKRILRELSHYHIVHFAGHAKYNKESPGQSGWCLRDGILTAQDILGISGGKKPFPFLIFSNACMSGHTAEWNDMEPNGAFYKAYDLVNAFLRAGTRHYIGTFQDIADPTGLDMSLYFYKSMLNLYTVGESLRRARLAVIEKYGINHLIWAFYMLYGDPTIRYIKNDTGEENGTMANDEYLQPLLMQGANYSLKAEKALTRTASGEETYNAPNLLSGGKADHLLEDEQRHTKGRVQVHRSKKLVIILTACLLLFLLCSIPFLAKRVTNDPVITQPQTSDLAWEREKWEIVRGIKSRLEERIQEGNLSNTLTPSSGTGDGFVTLCIVPDNNPIKQDTPVDRLSWDALAHLNEFWIEQPGYALVERERLDFVLDELSMATSGMSSDKIEFTLGKIFGARLILFVEAVSDRQRFSCPLFSMQTKIRLRLVNVETTQILGVRQGTIKGTKGLRELCRQLGEELLKLLDNKRGA